MLSSFYEEPDHFFIRDLKTKCWSKVSISESVPYFLVLIVLATFLLLFGVQIVFESENFVHVGWIEVVNCFKKFQSNT